MVQERHAKNARRRPAQNNSGGGSGGGAGGWARAGGAAPGGGAGGRRPGGGGARRAALRRAATAARRIDFRPVVIYRAAAARPGRRRRGVRDVRTALIEPHVINFHAASVNTCHPQPARRAPVSADGDLCGHRPRGARSSTLSCRIQTRHPTPSTN